MLIYTKCTFLCIAHLELSFIHELLNCNYTKQNLETVSVLNQRQLYHEYILIFRA